MQTQQQYHCGHALAGPHLGDELESFVSEGITVAEEDTFGQLAERCGLVQPAEKPGKTAIR